MGAARVIAAITLWPLNMVALAGAFAAPGVVLGMPASFLDGLYAPRWAGTVVGFLFFGVFLVVVAVIPGAGGRDEPSVPERPECEESERPEGPPWWMPFVGSLTRRLFVVFGACGFALACYVIPTR